MLRQCKRKASSTILGDRVIDKKLMDETGRQACLSRLAVLGTNDDAFSHITRVVRTALDLPIAAVTLIGADTQWIKSAQGMDITRTSRSSAFCNVTIEDRGTLVVENALEEVPFDTNEYVQGEPFIRSYVGVPLVTMDGYQVGSLCGMDFRPRTFLPNQVELLEQLAQCVENELELKMSAALDGLTRLLSRTSFMDLVETVRGKVGEGGLPISLAILDLDHFKSINDTFGHPVGDAVLRGAAAQIGRSLGTEVHAGRLGGEEFGVLLPGLTIEAAAAAMERFRLDLQDLRLIAGTERRVTASAGLAEILPRSVEPDITAAFKRADVALYRAKALGRNRVKVWDGQADEVPQVALVLPHLRRVRPGDGRINGSAEPEEIAINLNKRFGKAAKTRRRDFRIRRRSVA
ncbi:sensor domain-containing diguanylate cyclase [Acuticoccus sp. I52.16.1]|uniref:sensor domain-containing diguanylate cyclase n=1 Tax=Acuticoccus sp. I52.16.1 TaxID=2928472 RepID=UPI001FD3F59B|nr:sensor domain-containing diguanylate cyclase [Acuticoccus sp. I52.16.1]UOM32944.1 sensor domain-containing diguanylate cyclase [Acuticoccus sp. I52.16.1]